MHTTIKNKLKNLNGWILLDKPKGISSNKALVLLKQQLRKLFSGYKLPKIGHGGTLDPLASGILPIAIGEATKTVPFIMNKSKTYVFTIQFGVATKSYDLGTKVDEYNNFLPTKAAIKSVLTKFTGNITQQPPVYSAIKVNGVRAYKLARKNKETTLKYREVTIYNIKLLAYKKKLKAATFIATVSKGTYIRALARDIASSLKAIGVISYLRRTCLTSLKQNPLLLSCLLYNSGISLTSYLLTIEQALDDIPVISFNSKEAKEILNGKTHLLQNGLLNSLQNGVYQAKSNNKVFSLLNIVNGNITILRNFNQLIMEENDVDNYKS